MAIIMADIMENTAKKRAWSRKKKDGKWADMMRENKWTWIFLGLSFALLGVCAALSLQKDKTPPEIFFQENEILYREGMEDALLIEGVTAKDAQDGNVTDSVVIERINRSSDGKFVMVVYAASDRRGNFAKASRCFDIAEEEADSMEEQGGSEVKNNTSEAFSGKEKTEDEKETAKEESIEDEESGRDADGGRDEADSENDSADAEKEAENRNDSVKAEDSTENASHVQDSEMQAMVPDSHPNDTVTPETKPTDTPPSIRLKTGETTIKTGDGFDWANYIDAVSDDKDTAQMLYSNFRVAGMLDTSKPGTYQVSIRVQDSAGNLSQEQFLTVHVVE